jgi:hypothetical protein
MPTRKMQKMMNWRDARFEGIDWRYGRSCFRFRSCGNFVAEVMMGDDSMSMSKDIHYQGPKI